MLGAMLTKLCGSMIGRLPGVNELVRQRIAEQLPDAVRDGFYGALRELLYGRSPNSGLDVLKASYFLASINSAQYFLQHMQLAQNFAEPRGLIEFALKQCAVEGLILEFGVFRGDSLAAIARQSAQTVYGFDSFEGLPEDWTHTQRKGRFSLDGKLPDLKESNAVLVPGWFDKTLPAFLDEHSGLARFIHVDSDLYSSAATVLTALSKRIVPGTVIVFDEYFNYPGWERHEYRAFQEFLRETGLHYEYIGIVSSGESVAVKIV